MVDDFEFTTTTATTTTIEPDVQPEVPELNVPEQQSQLDLARDKISHWVDFLKNLLHFDQLTVISVDSGTMKSN